MKRRNLLKLALITPVVASIGTKLSVPEIVKQASSVANGGKRGLVPGAIIHYDETSLVEGFVYNRALSPSEIVRNQDHLAAKYNC